MKKKKIGKIKWTPVKVLVKDIQPTPNNYKIKTKLGLAMLQASLKEFGLAGTAVCNWAGKYKDKTKVVLIDGNSRREEAIEDNEKWLWVSMPDRVLPAKMFTEMAAMFDRAKAGEVDTERMDAELGKTRDFFNKYGMDIPMSHLAKLGANAKIDESIKFPTKKGKQDLEVREADIMMVQLFFDEKQMPQYRKMEEKLKGRFKTSNSTDTVFKAFKQLCK